MELCDLTIHELKRLYAEKEVGPPAVLAAVAQRIKAVEAGNGAYLDLDLESAFAQAQTAAERFKAGEPRGELEGIPVALPANLCQAGKKTTCASRILAEFVPPYTATALQRLAAQGAIILGRTNLDEFGLGSSTEYSVEQKTKNPWDPQRTPGGACGGSAAAVAAGETIAALGTDTGGALRLPAAFSGVTGLKPTYGLVSRYGLVALASSLDQIGPLAKDAQDCALLLNHLSGYDPLDATSVRRERADYTSDLARPLSGRKIGLPREYFGTALDEAVRRVLREAVAQLEALGVEIIELSLTLTEYALLAYQIILAAEASSNLARFDGIRYGQATPAGDGLNAYYTRTRTEGFGPEVKRQIMLGTYVRSAEHYDTYYRKAQQVRTLVRQEFEAAFQVVEALITPTAPTPPFPLGAGREEPWALDRSYLYTVPASLAGLPALSVPCGFVDGLPVGLQIIGPPFAEKTLLNIAHQYQKETDYHKARPPRRKEGAG
jgi:aspartyl-tRNA(Asn)/glutamyl-tRNA(Gln) amidotransferase subunit A